MKAAFHAFYSRFLWWAAGFATAFALISTVYGQDAWPLIVAAAVLMNVTALAQPFARPTGISPSAQQTATKAL